SADRHGLVPTRYGGNAVRQCIPVDPARAHRPRPLGTREQSAVRRADHRHRVRGTTARRHPVRGSCLGAVRPRRDVVPVGVAARGFGFLALGFAGGSLLGSVFAERFTKLLGEGPAIYASVAMSVGSDVVSFLTRNGYVAGASFAFIGFGSLVWDVLTVSLRQE